MTSVGTAAAAAAAVGGGGGSSGAAAAAAAGGSVVGPLEELELAASLTIWLRMAVWRWRAIVLSSSKMSMLTLQFSANDGSSTVVLSSGSLFSVLIALSLALALALFFLVDKKFKNSNANNPLKRCSFLSLRE